MWSWTGRYKVATGRTLRPFTQVALTNQLPGPEKWHARGTLAHHRLQGHSIRRSAVDEMMMYDEIGIVVKMRARNDEEAAPGVLM